MAESGEKSQQRWAWVGKALTTLAAIAGIGGFLFLLYDRYASGADLTVRVSVHDFRRPPEVRQASDAEEPEPWFERLPYLDYDKYVVVTINNSGGTQAEEAKLLMSEYSGVARISTDAGESREIEFSKSINIGPVAPSQEIKLQLWTRSAFTFGGEKDFVVRHRTGIADIIFLRETEGWWSETWGGMVAIGKLLLIIVGLLLAPSLFMRMLASGDKKKPPSTDEKPLDQTPQGPGST